MENYSYPPYPDSGESSPRSREIDFENPPPWDDNNQQNPPPNYKVKFMCSYGGKIQPRTHDNQLSYVGGETKILAVDRNIRFPSMLSKLASICDSDVTFKYQLPGEDLDALISVTNDDDLDHMMHEYDRLYRASAKPARMRLFLFPTISTPSDDRQEQQPQHRFIDPLNSAPASAQPDPVAVKPGNNVDFLFGLEKSAAAVIPPPQPPVAAVKFNEPAPPPGYQPRVALNHPDRVVGSDPNMNHPIEVQRQLQQMHITENDQAAYRRKSEDNIAGNYSAGDYYVQKTPEKFPASNFTANPPQQAGYWPERHVHGEVYPPTVTSAAGGGEPPVYMIPAPGTFYHAPVVRPPAQPATQGYYAVQRMPSDAYREAPVYSGVPPIKAPFSSAGPATLAPAQPVKAPAYTEGFGVVRPAGIPDHTAGAYAQVAYDSAGGRQVYYTAPGGGVVHAPPYQGVPQPVTADIRSGGVSLGHDVKVINKVSQGSV